jgi:hypothetical protein
MKMNEEASPMGGPNLSERISALQHAQLSHTGGKRPAGGMPLVLPDFSERAVEKKNDPLVLPNFAERAVKKNEPQRTGTEELWLVDSDTWEEWVEWPDANDTASPHTKENGFSPENSHVGDAKRIRSGSSSKARGPVLPLREKNFHSETNKKIPVTEPGKRQRRFSKFLASLSLMVAPDTASKGECDDVTTTSKPAAAAFSKSFESRADKKTKSQKGRVTRSAEPSAAVFDDFVRTLSTTSSSQGVTTWLRSMWGDATESSSSDLNQHSESFEQSVQSLALIDPPNAASQEECGEAAATSKSAAMAFSKSFERQAAKTTKSKKRQVTRGAEPSVAVFDDFLLTLSSTSSSQGVTSRLRSMWEDATESSSSDLKQHSEGFEQSFQPFDLNQSKDHETDEWPNILGHATRKVTKSASSTNRESGIGHRRHADQSSGNGRAGPRLSSATTVPKPEIREVDSSGKPFSWTLSGNLSPKPLPVMHTSYSGRRRGVLGIEERIDECEAPKESPRGTDVTDIAVRVRPRVAPPAPSIYLLPSKEVEEIDRLLSLLDPFTTEKRDSDSEALHILAERSRSFLESRKEKDDSLRSELSISSEDGLSEIRKSQLATDASRNDDLVASLQSRIDQAPRCLSGREATPPSGEAPNKAQQRLPKRRLDPPASEPVVTKQQTDASVDNIERAKPVAISEKDEPVDRFETNPAGTFKTDKPLHISQTGKPAYIPETDKLSDIKDTLSMKIKETLQKKSFASLLEEAPLQTESGDEEMSAHSSFALLGGERSMHSLQDVDSEQANRSFLERSLSQVSDFSPSSLCHGSSLNDMVRPPEMRNHAPDPIRDYWRNFATVKTRGSFDSVSIVNDKVGVVAHSSRVDRPHEYIPGHARIEEYDYEADERYNEDRNERMNPVRKRVEIREPREVEHRRSYSRAAAPVRHEVVEEFPQQDADRLMYVMSPLLSVETDLESTDAETQYTDLETTYTVESDAAEKAQHCSFLCGGLEFGFKGFPGCS